MSTTQFYAEQILPNFHSDSSTAHRLHIGLLQTKKYYSTAEITTTQTAAPPSTHSENMAQIASPKLELLRAKLALAIGPVEINLAYDEVKAARPDALDEPWSKDMSGPHHHVVFNNKAFVLSEVANEQLASGMARGCPSIDAGENIKLYLNDIWQLEVFRMMGLDLAAIRCPITGRDPLGSLYYSLITAVNERILKQKFHVNGNEVTDGMANLGIDDVALEEKGDELKEEEWPEGEISSDGGQEKEDGDQAAQDREKNTVKQMAVEEEKQAHVDAV
ncbi:hypothetical protein HO173_008692 [Letharia columbiana]|uniref:Uncharacterized protein n=1 Tax=Letharia columbiana TaxID=112416 RepID=A0A8H6FR37_9LECA|nr:uncharacterized protein HO173_008692 [Letharia columbiana]KAF6233148.1 hypothetical protein HO173_008692 [Letharia columbiana]